MFVHQSEFTYWPPCGIQFGEITGRPTRKELSAEGEVDELGCSGAEGLVGKSESEDITIVEPLDP